MSKRYSNPEAVAFVIKNEQHLLVEKTSVSLQGIYADKFAIAAASAGTGIGFLYGIQWFAKELEEALKRHDFAWSLELQLEIALLIKAGYLAPGDFHLDSNELMGRNLQ